MTLKQIAHEIITKNKYLTLATTDGNEPWAATLYYCVDKELNFYFISERHNIHVKHIKQQPVVACTIFDSHQPEGTGSGLQISGKCKELSGEELDEGLMYYDSSFIEIKRDELSGDSTWRMYRISPTSFFMPNPHTEEKEKTEIDMK